MPVSSPDPATGLRAATGAGPPTSPSPRPGPTDGSGGTAGADQAGADQAGAVPRVITAATGSELHCRGWPQEAAWRMLHNNLDPAVAERPEDLVVYGGGGKAARDWPSFDAISRTLLELGDDETLLVQSGRPVGVLRTHEWAPRVLIANSNLVGEWDNWEEFRRLEHLGLTMYGQMTAGSWIYIGTQGILQGTYETFATIADRRFHGSLAGTLTVTAGAGGMGGAQPLAVTMNGGVVICADVDPTRLQRRLETRYFDVIASDIDEATRLARQAQSDRMAQSIGVAANAVELLERFVERSEAVDIVTDQTPAHDPMMYVPLDLTVTAANDLRRADPPEYLKRARESMARHVTAMLALLDRGAEVFDYGNSLRAEARLAGVDRAFDYPGFVPAYIRPLFCEGKGPFRWAALSGDPADIGATDRAVLEEFPDNEPLARWIRMASDRVAFQGLPARICWLGLGERARMGARFNDMVASGQLRAPIVIGRDHLDCGSVASPYRETERMADGSDAIADWPLLNAMVNVASGASWVSIHDGGGVGIGRSLHAGQVCVADGTPLAAAKLERVLTNDPAMGVIRHVDAGYREADLVAKAAGLDIPSRQVVSP
jgi:urocanate hydratase